MLQRGRGSTGVGGWEGGRVGGWEGGRGSTMQHREGVWGGGKSQSIRASAEETISTNACPDKYTTNVREMYDKCTTSIKHITVLRNTQAHAPSVWNVYRCNLSVLTRIALINLNNIVFVLLTIAENNSLAKARF